VAATGYRTVALNLSLINGFNSIADVLAWAGRLTAGLKMKLLMGPEPPPPPIKMLCACTTATAVAMAMGLLSHAQKCSK
jgi:hypothetical protein